MYIVKPYIEDEDRVYYGVYIKTDCLYYNIDKKYEDNLVVLCYSLKSANKIADILNNDHEFEEAIEKYN